ncbi:MAG: branched-chain amino acid ABC transporter permease [Alphaproteobacteria bacterium]
MLAQLLLNALALGAAYALVALGFVVVINTTNAVNFAHGEAVMVGGFLAVALTAALPPALTANAFLLLPLVMIAMAGLGLIISLVAYLPLRHEPPTSVFVSTIAVGVILANSVNALFGAAPRTVPPLLAGGPLTIQAPGLNTLILSRQSLAIIAAAILLIGGLTLLFTKTQLGRRLRATAQDAEMARAIGIDTTAMIALSFALATALAGAAGLLLANQFFVSPSDGGTLMLKAYIAVVIGGWGSLTGAVIGAMLIALFEVVAAVWVSHPLAEGLLYATLFALLLLRPQGLLGETTGRRA